MSSFRRIAGGVVVMAAVALSACVRTGVQVEPAGTSNLPAGVSPMMVATGDSLFAGGSCQRCHGVGGVGGENGPPLTTGPWLQTDGTFEGIVQVITTGVPTEKLKDPERRAMRARGGPMNLNNDQIQAVAGYVYSISRAKR